MMEFAWPWVFLILPLPLVARRALPVFQRNAAALRVPFGDDLRVAGGAAARGGSHNPWVAGLALCAWLALLVAGAQPQWLGEPIVLPMSGRDLLLAVDTSGSMQRTDFFIEDAQVSRLAVTKDIAGEFIQRRDGDRIGLILFGEQAYLQAPLTFDRKTVNTLLQEAMIGLAGNATAIGDAIGLAIKRLSNQKVSHRVLVLMTDGANTAGTIEPLKAAELAAGEKLKIYTIGVGADTVYMQDFFGTRKVDPSADLDEASLQRIAALTGGKYFRARDTEGLAEIYRLLDQLEPAAIESQHFRPRKPLYFWPLGLSLGLTTLLLFARRPPTILRHAAG